MTKSRLTIVLALLAACLGSAALTACDTTKGFGEDMSSAGHSISNEAQKDK